MYWHRIEKEKSHQPNTGNYSDWKEQIAKECGVKRQTIERDKREWRQSGDFEDWIKEEWLRLHLLIQQKDPVIAYREITRLLGKTLTQKVETALTQKQPFVVKMWKPEKDAEK